MQSGVLTSLCFCKISGQVFHPHFCVWAGGWADREEARVRYERGGGRGGCVSACSCNPTPAPSFPSTAQKKVFSSEILICLLNVVNPDPVIWQSLRQIFNSDPNVYLSHKTILARSHWNIHFINFVRFWLNLDRFPASLPAASGLVKLPWYMPTLRKLCWRTFGDLEHWKVDHK